MEKSLVAERSTTMPYEPGQQMGNYRLMQLLGHGGFSDVFLGEHIYLKTQAAIKVLQMQLATDERGNFLNEARTIAHLVHPNIIRVLDFGIQGYTPFLVMDYAPNGTLRQRHANGSRLPLITIVSYVKQVASALQYAHKQNFIHRDVKPGNMLIGREDEILLSDFGIALIAQNTNSQITQDTIGTVAYMSPEQIEGKPRPASDQYSLGIVVYEWLCGERPFRGSLTEIVTQQLSSAPPPLHARFPEISREVEEAVMTALAKDPHDRFATVQAFAHAIEQANQSAYTASVASYANPSSLFSQSIPPTQPAIFLPEPTQSSRSSMAPLQEETKLKTQPAYSNSKPISQEYESPHRNLDPAYGSIKSPMKRGVSQIIAMLIGLALYGGVYYFISYLSFQRKEFASYALFSLSIAIPLFFGVEFGPLVGLITGTGGYILGHYLSHTTGYWNNALGIGLTAMIAGFAILRTKGEYHRFRGYVTVGFFSALGVIIGEGFADLSSIWVAHSNIISATINFVIFVLLELLFALLLLPVLLIIYHTFTRHKQRA
jgi:serine/threonine protein kinase